MPKETALAALFCAYLFFPNQGIAASNGLLSSKESKASAHIQVLIPQEAVPVFTNSGERDTSSIESNLCSGSTPYYYEAFSLSDDKTEKVKKSGDFCSSRTALANFQGLIKISPSL